MTEATQTDEPAASASGGPAPAASAVCGRCGAFVVPESLQRHGDAGYCPECHARLLASLRELRLYPVWYLWVITLLGNFTAAAVLAAISWQRLNHRVNFLVSVIVAGAGVIAVFLLLLVPHAMPPTGMSLAINIVGTAIVSRGLGARYKAHRALGGGRASLLWPVLIVLAVTGGIVTVTALLG